MADYRGQGKEARGMVPCETLSSAADVVSGLTDSDCPEAHSVQSCFPDLMTESELIQYLRIPELSNSKSYGNVIEHLKRFRGLPRIHICNKALYPKKAIQHWIDEETSKGD
jgi:hypothetical protein